MADITIKELLEAGAHFGHQKNRWNPKMQRYIFEERNGLYIIDLAKTLHQVRTAIDVVKNVIADNKSILFVGTKKQAKSVIRECAEMCGEYYVCERWLGGMLTNFKITVSKSVKKLERIEDKIASGMVGFTKKEISQTAKYQAKLDRVLSGVRSMRKQPGLVVVVDPSNEHIAVAEAKKLGIPVMALIDTNCDPDPIDYIIAANDDALKSVKLIIQTLAQAIVEQKNEMRAYAAKEGEDDFVAEEKSEEKSAEETLEMATTEE